MLFWALSDQANSVTGQMSGEVVDASGGAVIGAVVRLTNDLNQQERTFTTAGNGSFFFTGLVPGNYSLKIAMTGFKTWEEKAINVSTQERVDMHTITLSVGDVSGTVEVQAALVHVATDSSNRAIPIVP